MKSPDGRYEAYIIDPGEVAMGSPEYGRLQILGAAFDTRDRQFGLTMSFSPDSRFFAVDELIGTQPGPHTRAIVFDFARERIIVAHDQNPGLIRRLTWTPTGLLTIKSWSLFGGEREHFWQAPPLTTS